MKPESQIQWAICQYLTFRPDLMFWVYQNTGVYDPTNQRFRKKNPYAIKGVSDIIVIMQVMGIAVPIFLEIKKPKQRTNNKTYQSKDQKEFQALVESKSAFYFVIRSIDDVVDALNFTQKQIKERLSCLELSSSRGPLVS